LAHSDPSLDVLVLTDLHYVNEADHVCPIEQRKCALGVTLVKRAFEWARDRGVDVELVVVLGDVVDSGEASGADSDLAAVVEAVRRPGIPVLAVPGNHDGSTARFCDAFECSPGIHEVGGYRFLLFADDVGLGDVTTRPMDGLDLPKEAARVQPKMPLVALQHNPLHPAIESDYPFVLTNVAEVLSTYRDAGVILSLSGHYHPGQAHHRVGQVSYVTVPALCEEPFHFAHVRLRGREVMVEEVGLDAQQ
jgi:predicted MPP superfamily phosphohydrolase